MTYLGQKFCVVVYPAVGGSSSDSSNGNGSREEGEEMKEVMSPLSQTEEDTHKSAEC